MSFISYAQNYEDVVLWRVLKDVPRGFYIDVGAQDPDVDSVTRAFYDRGWSGINVEPVQKYYEMLCRARPRDINLNVLAGAHDAEREFYEIAETGLSTVDSSIAEIHQAAGRHAVLRRVPQRPLSAIWQERVTGDVQFLKIDAEGAEREVLEGAALDRHRPWIVLVEAVAPLSQAAAHDAWEQCLAGADYVFAYFDGLNRFYVAREKSDLMPRLAVPPNFFDDFVRVRESTAIQDAADLRSKAAQVHMPGEIDGRLGRIESAIQSLSSSLNALAQRTAAIQPVLHSQTTYLGDHRALTYLQSGQKIFVDTRSVDIGTHLLLGGWWEPNYATAFCNLLKAGDTVLDVGANHGFYSLIAAPRIAPGGHIYAFEPSRSFYELIKASVSVNGLDQIVSVHNVALSSAEGDVTLAFDRSWSGGGHLEVNASAPLDPSSTIERETVRAVPLDDFVGANIDHIDVIKMDIEGAEGLALKGMNKLIDRSPTLKMMLEFCPSMMAGFELDAKFVVEFLESKRFLCWEIDVAGSLVPARWPGLLQDPDRIRNIIVSRQGLQ
ncbi:MAG TPA: FkbM family methyltransferase [Casimicrobiaceae bacterium]|jgi:FkbM family methyltransferase